MAFTTPMQVGQLEPSDLARHLQGPGLRVRTGPVVTNIRSSLPEVSLGLALHYAEHALEAGDGFADFHVRVDAPRGVRRWFDPQVVFHFDDMQPFTPMPGEQGFALLEWGLNWCVSSHCHQYLMMRSAVIERNGRALVLPAPSGSGKSTLCAALVYGGGWRLLSDEMALLDPATGQLVPLPRPVSLKNASIEAIRGFAPEAVFGDEVRETNKGRIAHVRPPAECVTQAARPALPGWIVLPQFAAGESAQLEPLSRARAFMALIDNAFNYEIHARKGFATLAAMVDRSRAFTFRYSSLAEAVSVFDALATRPA